MCGFVGVLSLSGSAGRWAERVATSAELVRHRGPDQHGTWHDDDVAVAFHRLAIVDLDGSSQPVHDATGRHTVVFNGEIYNHAELREELAVAHGAHFTTDGEAEVIAVAHRVWGDTAVHRLRGMFAYLVWDRGRRRLVAVRDAFGIKPLHVARGRTAVAFASEQKSLLELVPHLDGDVPAVADRRVRAGAPWVQRYLAMQYVPEPGTTDPRVERVEPGTALCLRPDGGGHTLRWFTPVLRATSAAPAELHRRIGAALEDSVSRHVRADVPVGALLSGGIDSTAIAALAARHVPDLVTFTVGFDRPGYSEIDAAAESAAALGVRHVARTITPAEVVDALPRIVWHLDDPVADPALVPLWFVAQEARRHVPVVLSGEGADELFAGYRIYREPRSLAAFDRLPTALRSALGGLARLLPEGVRGKDLLRRGALPLERRYYGGARVFRDDQLPAVLPGHDPRWSPPSITAEHYRTSAGWDPVARMQHIDLCTWLPGDILLKADRMTMAHGLELRVPFLDRVVWDVARGLPPEAKLAGRATKVALRAALRDVVPAPVVDRPKLGFPVPVAHWLRDELHDWAREVVRGSLAGHLVDLRAAEALLDAHRRGAADHGRRLWALLVLLVWHAVVVDRTVEPWAGARAVAA